VWYTVGVHDVVGVRYTLTVHIVIGMRTMFRALSFMYGVGLTCDQNCTARVEIGHGQYVRREGDGRRTVRSVGDDKHPGKADRPAVALRCLLDLTIFIHTMNSNAGRRRCGRGRWDVRCPSLRRVQFHKSHRPVLFQIQWGKP
jgi:hypothetical protein